MVSLARENADRAGAKNVEFLEGAIEDVPLPDGAVDVVISNCVVNLSTDKPAVLAEMFRLLAPGGRIGISDVIAEDQLSAADRAERGSYVGCIAGALSGRSTWTALRRWVSSAPRSRGPVKLPRACTTRSFEPAARSNRSTPRSPPAPPHSPAEPNPAAE